MEEKNLRDELLKQAGKTEQELQELFEKNKENISAFFEQFSGEGFKPNTEFKITASDVALLHNIVQMLDKAKEEAQIQSVLFSIQQKEVQKLLFSIASNGFTKELIKE